MSLHDEILEQPDVAQRLLTGQRAAVEPSPRPSRAATSTWCSSRRAAARTTPPSTPSTCSARCTGSRSRWRRRPSPRSTACTPRLERALVIGISQSGRSPDVVGVLDAARAQGAPTIAITNDAESALARAADHVIDIGAGPERATAATKTYTMSLLAVAMLVAAIDGGTGCRRATGPRAAGRPRRAARGHGRGARQRSGRGGGRREPRRTSTAASCWAAASSTPRRASGRSSSRSWPRSRPTRTPRPTSSTARWRSSSPATRSWRWRPRVPRCAGMTELLRRLRDEHGVDLAHHLGRPRDAALGAAALATPAAPAEWLSPLVSTLPGQLFAYHLTRARGQDTERPRWISKVTLTH